jgi:signal transduction histidine kinase
MTESVNLQAVDGADSERASILARLQAHRTLGSAPREELEWLVARGSLRRFAAGETLVAKGQDATGTGIWVILSGSLTIYVDRGAGPKRVIDWRAGDISGVLPFSRVTTSIGTGVGLEAGEFFQIEREHYPELIRECPEVTAILVHVMLDRARHFNTSDLHDEKMVSLGKLAAGLAHELNNPASAVVRNSTQLEESLADLAAAARTLGAAGLAHEEVALLDRFRVICAASAAQGLQSPIDRADREDAISDWLRSHGTDLSAAGPLAESGITLAALEELSSVVDARVLDVAVRWIAADCAARTQLSDIRTASSRIYDLVGAVKRYTYMDRSQVAEPIDVAQGLRDTVAVMRSKARKEECELTLDVPAQLPLVRAIGGELNQVWSNLIDNALDAAPRGGHVVISARAEANAVSVTVCDDGPGIAPELRDKIFDPFFTTKPVGQGTGLGLDIARRLARRHGGDIEVHSQPLERRTEFRVELPIMQRVEPA